MTRKREPWVSLLLYHLFKWSVVSPTFHLLFRGKIYGADRVPKTGPLVVVSNHASYFDPPFVSNCVGRPVAFMAKAELFNVPVLSQAIKLYGAYPVKRGGVDRQALKAARAALDEGWAAGIFLNGTRSEDGRIDRPHLGAASIAARAKAPLLPVALRGTHAILPKGQRQPRLFRPISVHIGEVIPPPASTRRDDLEAVTEQCTAAIHALLDETE